MNNTDQLYIDHEVRIQIQEEISKDIKNKFNQMEIAIESRFNRIDQRFERIDDKFNRIDDKFNRMEDNIKETFHRIDNKMDSHFKWMLGTIILLIITVFTFMIKHS